MLKRFIISFKAAWKAIYFNTDSRSNWSADWNDCLDYYGGRGFGLWRSPRKNHNVDDPKNLLLVIKSDGITVYQSNLYFNEVDSNSMLKLFSDAVIHIQEGKAL